MNPSTAVGACIECGEEREGRRYGSLVLCPDCTDGWSRQRRRRRFRAEMRKRLSAAMPEDPSLSDYLTPVGEYLPEVSVGDYPAYEYFEPVAERIVERRAQFLAAEYGLPERMARAHAAAHVIGDRAWMRDNLEVAESTFQGYLDQIQESEDFGWYAVTGERPTAIEEPLDTSGPTVDPSTCGECGNARVTSVRAAEMMYPGMSEGLKRAIESARAAGKEMVCASCHTTFHLPGADDEDAPSAKGSWSNVPEYVREIPRWVCHEDKVPVAPWAGGPSALQGGAQNENGWAPFRTAADWAHKHPAWGMMFSLNAGDDVCVVDLDDVVDEDGNVSDEARDLVERFDTYTEFSPSGNGLHIVLRGEVPVDRTFRDIEVYDRGRGVTFTGRAFHDVPVRERQGALDELVEERAMDEDPHERFYDTGEFDGEGSAFHDIPVTALYDVPVGKRVPHPIHGSTTGGNFRVRSHGETATCFRGQHRFGGGEGCVLAACHLLGMEAAGIEDCAEARERWREDDGFVLDAFVHAVDRGLNFDFTDVPPRVLAAAAEEVGMDVGASDKGEAARAYQAARMNLRQNYNVPVPDRSA